MRGRSCRGPGNGHGTGYRLGDTWPGRKGMHGALQARARWRADRLKAVARIKVSPAPTDIDRD
ncbi:hypothetical protein [Novosphingobium terrae]|uniref:hypothetical protein n=1 Tax=Novosphingobium terrae TaxID=2726189 RepID=UPI00197D2334|nr:hypothetical protein [Novosphingobium terrae]